MQIVRLYFYRTFAPHSPIFSFSNIFCLLSRLAMFKQFRPAWPPKGLAGPELWL
jgi:hypothetical protein